MRYAKAFLAGAAVLAAAATLAPPSRAQDGDVVARLDSGDVTLSDLAPFMTGVDPAIRGQAAKDPQLLSRLLRTAVGRIAVLRDAEKQGWDKKPDVAAQIERARQEAIVATYLQSVAAPPAGFPSEDEIRRAYDANRGQFVLPRQYHLAQIFVAVPAGAGQGDVKARETRARELDRKAKAKNADFAELARSNSDDKQTAPQGGDLGWLPETQVLPEIAAVIRNMGDDDVSEPIRSSNGWHIVRVIDTKPAATRPLDEVHDLIAARLRQRKLLENEQAYLAKLLDAQHLAINEIAAGKLVAPAK